MHPPVCAAKAARGLVVAALALSAVAACSGHSGGSAAGAGGGTATTTTAGTTSTGATSPGATSTPTVAPQPDGGTSTAAPPVGPAKLRAGDHGAAVLQLQQHLTTLGYWLGKPDGHFGDLTQQAVYALQKAAGLQRDGVVGTKTLAALTAGKRPTITTSGTGHRIEINKKTQLLLIIDGTKITTILNTSTGSGRTYIQQGRPEVALTPSGRFKIDRQIDGERIGPLGALWRPKYFNAGIAIHGISSVPPYPASHGCARLSNAAIDWIWSSNQAPIGTSVTVV